MQRSWRMTVYDLPVAGSAAVDGGAHRFFYVREGRVAVRSGRPTALESDTGFFSQETIHSTPALWTTARGDG